MTNNHEFDHENEHNNDFVEPEHGVAENENRGGARDKLKGAWGNPGFKFMVLIIAVFAVGVAGFSFFGGGNNGADSTHLGRPPALKEAPGGAMSPYMRQQTELANKQRVEQAAATGGSAMPTPIGQSADVGGFGAPEKKDDPLNELRAEVDRLKKEQTQQQVQQKQLQQRPAEPFDNSLAEAMQQQMKQLLDSWNPKGIKNVSVTRIEDLKNDALAKGQSAANGALLASQTSPQTQIVVNAGTVSYAQLLTEANSDVPGPILAQIVSGPLAGSRAVGSFQVSAGYEKYLVLKFSLADKKGKDYAINAIALDPNTTLGGMATEVDERYFVRVVLPAAAGFLQGLGEGASEGNSTITNTSTSSTTTIAGNSVKYGVYNGLGQAAQTMGQFFQNQANLTKPLVRVAAGTPIGVFFVTPVTEPTGTPVDQTNPQNGAAQNGINPVTAAINNLNGVGAGGNAASGVPYPNYAVPGYGYTGNSMTRYPGSNSGGSGYAPTVQNFGQ